MKDQVTTLSEIIPQLSLSMAADKEWSLASASNGWFDVDSIEGALIRGKFFAYQDEIDVSGWGNQGLSFFPMQAGIQEGYVFNYLIDDELRVIDVISDCPLDVGAFVLNNVAAFPNITVPALYEKAGTGRTFAPLGWENVLYGNDRLMQHNNNLQGLLVLPVSSNDFGSMNPTATDKLYLTRILSCGTSYTAQTGGLAYIPPTRFIIKGMLKEESALSYIFRLKDSFKTTQTDVGYNGL